MVQLRVKECWFIVVSVSTCTVWRQREPCACGCVCNYTSVWTCQWTKSCATQNQGWVMVGISKFDYLFDFYFSFTFLVSILRILFIFYFNIQTVCTLQLSCCSHIHTIQKFGTFLYQYMFIMSILNIYIWNRNVL